jgi:tetratricopeptide (TPR) repeat protein
MFNSLERDSVNISETHYNAGNSLFQQRKLEEALEEYKNALRANPSDMDAKFNLAYTKKLLEKDKQQQQQNQDDKNQDKNKDQNQDNKDNKDQQQNQDQQQDKQNQDQNKDKDNNQDKNNDQNQQQNQDDKQQPQDSKQSMSRNDAEQLLNAMQMSEDKTREKVDAQEAKAAVAVSGKNW